jgi:hypothetical protein
MGNGRPRDTSRDDAVVQAVQDGLKTGEIAARFGLSRSRICRLVNDLRDLGRLPRLVAKEPVPVPVWEDYSLMRVEPRLTPVIRLEPKAPTDRSQQLHYHYDGGFSLAAMRADDPFRETRHSMLTNARRGQV